MPGASGAPRGAEDLTLPDWALPLLRPARWKCVHGGRGSGKSHALATLLLLRMLGRVPGYPEGPVLAILGREHRNAVDRSAAAVLQAKIHQCGLGKLFEFRRESLKCLATGSEAIYAGLSVDTVENLRSLEGVSISLIEEGQRLQSETAASLVPTVLRRDDAEVWVAFNPRYPGDWATQRFLPGDGRPGPRPDDLVIKADWRDNPWWPAPLEAERQALARENPALCRHVYDGELLIDEASIVLSPDRLREAVGPPLTPAGAVVGGFDLAFSSSGDRNALVIRRGADIVHVESWPGGPLEASCRRVWRRMSEWAVGTPTLVYDASGSHDVPGAIERAGGGMECVGVQFGAGPEGAGRLYSRGVTNSDMFARRAGQIAWAVRDRLARGPEHPADQRLRFVEGTPGLDDLLRQCARPTWRETRGGKIEVEKGVPSPDLYDALAMACSTDARRGLVKHRQAPLLGVWGGDGGDPLAALRRAGLGGPGTSVWTPRQ